MVDIQIQNREQSAARNVVDKKILAHDSLDISGKPVKLEPEAKTPPKPKPKKEKKEKKVKREKEKKDKTRPPPKRARSSTVKRHKSEPC